jgi:uncharacterized protein (TIGR02599 family)
MTVLMLMMVLMLSVVNSTASLWRKTSGKVQSYQAARAGLETVSQTLAQAVLNPYYDYTSNGIRRNTNNAATFVPNGYSRFSDLQFVITDGTNLPSSLPSTINYTHAVLFQAPLAYATNSANALLPRLLNVAGFFVSYGSDQQILPNIPALSGQGKTRFRLWQILQPAEDFGVYTNTSSTPGWVTAGTGNSRIVADNIIALILQPKTSAGETSAINDSYYYNSRPANASDTNRPSLHQLPPMVGVTMVAIDEDSAARLERTNGLKATLDPLLTGKFTDPTLYATNLSKLRDDLDSRQIGYRVFTTDVGIRAAKWSEK